MSGLTYQPPLRDLLGFAWDDGGRAAAGFRGSSGDCVVRAVTILTGRWYSGVRQTVREIMEEQGVWEGNLRDGVPNDVWPTVLRHYRFQRVRRPRGPWPTYTAVSRLHHAALVTSREHVSAILDGFLRDTHDWRVYPWDDGEPVQRKAGSVWLPPSIG